MPLARQAEVLPRGRVRQQSRASLEQTHGLGQLVVIAVEQPDGVSRNRSKGSHVRGELGASVRVRNSAFSQLAVTGGDGYSHADREFVDEVISADWGYDVVLPLHIPDALASGVRLEAIEALRSGRDDLLTDDERFLATFIRQVESRTLTDESWERMVKRIGLRGAVEYMV